MKFDVSSSALLAGLQSISKVIASKNTLPILDSFLFELEGNLLTLTAADPEIRFARLDLFLQLADLSRIFAPLGESFLHDVVEPLALGAELFELRGFVPVIGERAGKLGGKRFAFVTAL